MSDKLMLPIELTKILYSSWEGQISISSQDSEIYGKCLNGKGSVTFKNGNKYSGNFYNGLLNGTGKFTWSNGIQYQGDFKHNRITGTGVYNWPDGSIYEGEVKDGLRHGYGKYTVEEATYEGEWLNGKKHGKGKIIFKSGSIFEGEFSCDRKNGLGKMYYYPSGNFFEGNWENDMKQNFGTMNWADTRQKYAGQWHHNFQSGWGTHIWLESKGEGKLMRNRYEGQWQKGVRHGYGTFYYANGSKYQGYWVNNMKEGYAFYTNDNGLIEHIFFEKDRMIRSRSHENDQKTIKSRNSKEVEPNFYSQSLDIKNYYYPQTPNLEYLCNYLLRNNTQLKAWYRAVSGIYQQKSEHSFCLNLQGIWKIIRNLKILGDCSLFTLNRGLKQFSMNVEHLLRIADPKERFVDYQSIYYKNQVKFLQSLSPANLQSLFSTNQQSSKSVNPFLSGQKQSERSLLLREFVQMLVWMSVCLYPGELKPQSSAQKLMARVAPFFDSFLKAIPKHSTLSGSDQISDNKSSISKAEKAITTFYKNINSELMAFLRKPSPNLKARSSEESSLKMREVIGYGVMGGVFGENDFGILEKIIDKYFDGDVLSRKANPNLNGTEIPEKVLNVLDYDLIQYEFIELIYILLVKKLPSHRQTEDNKLKYQEFINKLKAAATEQFTKQRKRQSFCSQKRYFYSKKVAARAELEKKREHYEEIKRKIQQKEKEKERQKLQNELMKREDCDIKNEQFDDESEFEI